MIVCTDLNRHRIPLESAPLSLQRPAHLLHPTQAATRPTAHPLLDAANLTCGLDRGVPDDHLGASGGQQWLRRHALRQYYYNAAGLYFDCHQAVGRLLRPVAVRIFFSSSLYSDDFT